MSSGSDVSDGRRKKTMSRPFGVALLVAGVDDEGPSLWCADPSGRSFFRCPVRHSLSLLRLPNEESVLLSQMLHASFRGPFFAGG